MRTAAWGSVGFLVLMMVAWGWTTGNVGYAQRVAPSPNGSPGLITHVETVGDSRQQLTVIDPDMRVIAVYHIDLAKGETTLKSVRNFHWDLQMVEFNTAAPLPREIRSMLDQK